MENKNISKFVFTDNEMAIKAEPYAVIECREPSDFSYLFSLIDRDKGQEVLLEREMVRDKEYCTVFCPNCGETIFIKLWAERAGWVLNKFCGECGKRLHWSNLIRGGK